MLSPIDILLEVDGGGTEAWVITPYVGSALDYDPTASADFVPGEPQKTKVNGIFSDGYAEGMVVGEIATLLIPASCLPADMIPTISQCLLFDTTYTVTRFRKRVWMGEVDGYNLFLAV